MSFVAKLMESRKHLTRIVTAKCEGRRAWYILRVDPEKWLLFQGDIKSKENLDLSRYGTILESGWGIKPPQGVLDRHEVKFAEDSSE